MFTYVSMVFTNLVTNNIVVASSCCVVVAAVVVGVNSVDDD